MKKSGCICADSDQRPLSPYALTASGEPGRSLHALTNPTIDSLISTHEDLTATSYVLAADTTYWLVLHRQWGSDNIRFSASICDRLATPGGVTTGEAGWSLGESLFYGLGSRWQVAPMGCRRMRMAVYASAQTSSQNQAANSPATGWPGITGTVRAGETLTATTDRIEDEDGLTDAVFAYQWVRQDPATITDADIEGATISTYTVTDDDAGKAIKVRVTFTDDAGNAESLTSDARLSAPPLVIPDEEPPPESTETAETPLTAAIHDAPESHDGEKKFTFELRFSEDPKEDFSYKTLRDHAFTVTRGTVAGARRLDGDSDTRNIKWEISVTPDSNADVTVELPATTDCNAQGAICTEDGTMLSSPLKFTVKGPPLTASFESVPTSHNGSGEFRFRIAFSEAPKSGFSYTTMRDHAFTVTGGSVTGARRLVSGKNLRWEIVVSPDSNADVTDRLCPPPRTATRRGPSAPTATGSCPKGWSAPSAVPVSRGQREEASTFGRTGEAGAPSGTWTSAVCAIQEWGSCPPHRRESRAVLWERLYTMPRQRTSLQQKNLRRSRRLPAAARGGSKRSPDLSWSEIARRLKTYRHTVGRWCTAGVRPNQHHLRALLALADYFGLSYLYTE